MARTPGAQPVKGGQMSPVATEQAARSRQFAEQKAMLERKEAGETSRTAMRAASTKNVAEVQAGAQRDVAAMQVEAADKRAAQVATDQEADRQMQLTKQQRGFEFQTNATNNLQRREDSIANSLVDQGRVKEEQMAKYTIAHGKMADKYDNDTRVVANIGMEIAETLDITFSALKFLPETKEEKKKPRQTILGFPQFGMKKPISGIRGDKSKEVYQEVNKSLTNTLNDKLRTWTNGAITLGMDSGDLLAAAEEGKVQYGDVLGGVATLHAFRKQLASRLRSLEVGTGKGKDDTTLTNNAMFDAGEETLLKIDKTLNTLRKLKQSKDTGVSKMYSEAFGIISKGGTGALARALREKYKTKPIDLAETRKMYKAAYADVLRQRKPEFKSRRKGAFQKQLGYETFFANWSTQLPTTSTNTNFELGEQ